MAARLPFAETEALRPEFDRETRVTLTKTPVPHFKAGGGLNDLPNAQDFHPDNATWRTVDPDTLSKADAYKFISSGVAPRPIAFVSSMGPDGNTNLAPFSYFNVVSPDPPTVMVSIGNNPAGREGLKDTVWNILKTKEFAVSIISEPFVEAANYTAMDAPLEVDEYALSGLTPRKSETIKPPHVAESAFSMECTLTHHYKITSDDGKTEYTMVLGRVRRVHVKEFLFGEDKLKVLPERLRPASRFGGTTYGRSMATYDIMRPKWADFKDTEEVKKIVEQGKK